MLESATKTIPTHVDRSSEEGSSSSSSNESFSSVVNRIKNSVCKHGVYTPFIRFTVLDGLFGDVTFTTSNDPDKRNEICCITSFENNKNGSGMANTFSITIAYSPSKG